MGITVFTVGVAHVRVRVKIDVLTVREYANSAKKDTIGNGTTNVTNALHIA